MYCFSGQCADAGLQAQTRHTKLSVKKNHLQPWNIFLFFCYFWIKLDRNVSVVIVPDAITEAVIIAHFFFLRKIPRTQKHVKMNLMAVITETYHHNNNNPDKQSLYITFSKIPNYSSFLFT